MKKEHFLQSEGFKTVAASVLSILIGLAVGSIVILIVGLTSPNLSLSSAWDGIRIVFGGLFSTGRSASGTLTWGFNPTNIGNMLFPDEISGQHAGQDRAAADVRPGHSVRL